MSRSIPKKIYDPKLGKRVVVSGPTEKQDYFLHYEGIPDVPIFRGTPDEVTGWVEQKVRAGALVVEGNGWGRVAKVQPMPARKDGDRVSMEQLVESTGIYHDILAEWLENGEGDSRENRLSTLRMILYKLEQQMVEAG